MVEKMVIEQSQDAARQGETDTTKGTSKRKKTADDAGTPPLDDDDYGFGPKGKKAKGGTGYAGNVKEDVRQDLSLMKIPADPKS
jgi:hypothetical protein